MSRRPLIPILSVYVTLLSIGLGVVQAAADEKAPASLVGKDLSAWRDNPGEWKIVGQATMAPEDPKRIATKPGQDVLVNGPTGKTKNIFSKLEHADVEAHTEFMLPEGSNSGV